jgi:curved DNA-binding protein CbpA
MTADHYQILGVRTSASLEEIEAAYRRLSHEFHPDVNDDDDAAERFKAVREAYETLSDPERRVLYDAELAAAVGATRAAGTAPSAGPSEGSEGSEGSRRFTPEREYPPPSAPLDVVHKLYEDHALGKDIRHVWHHDGEWMVWRTTCWVKVDEAELRQTLYLVLREKWYWHHLTKGDEPRWWDPTETKVNTVLHALRAAVHLPSEVDAPSWTEPPAGIQPPPWPFGSRLSSEAYIQFSRKLCPDY